MDSQPVAMWQQQPGEDNAWFTRFEAFRLMGAGRSVKLAYEKDKARHLAKFKTLADFPKYPTWQRVSGQWHWSDRAAAYDADAVASQARSKQEDQTYIRQTQRENRRSLYDAVYQKVIEFVKSDKFDLTGAKPNEVATFIKLLLQEGRAEYDDLPTQALKLNYTGMSNEELLNYIEDLLKAE